MATTTTYNIDTSIPEYWAKLTLREMLRQGFWSKFLGSEGSGSCLIQRSDLLNGPGDLVHIQTGVPLTGTGVEGDNATLEGNEDNLTLSEIKVQPKLYRHGVRFRSRAQQKSIVALREEAKMRIADWGQDKMDAVRFAQFISGTASDTPDSTYTPNIYYYDVAAATNTAVTDLVAADKMSVDAVKRAKYKLMANKAKPFRDNQGGHAPVYFGVISPEQEFDLKNDTTYGSYATTAMLRGSDNPVFTGALCEIDGVVLFPHFNVPCVTSNVRVAKSLFFGQEAFVEAFDQNVEWAERDFDYGADNGVGFSFAFQPRRGLELNSLQVITSAVAPA